MIVADTNVVSELMRDEPDPAVLTWARGLAVGEVTLTVITVTEVEYGLVRLPPGKRRDRLTTRWQQIFDAYADTILDYDLASARAAAAILAERDRTGRPVGLADAQIAAVCRVGSHQLATRNTKDFDGLGLDIVNPFNA